MPYGQQQNPLPNLLTPSTQNWLQTMQQTPQPQPQQSISASPGNFGGNYNPMNMMAMLQALSQMVPQQGSDIYRQTRDANTNVNRAGFGGGIGEGQPNRGQGRSDPEAVSPQTQQYMQQRIANRRARNDATVDEFRQANKAWREGGEQGEGPVLPGSGGTALGGSGSYSWGPEQQAKLDAYEAGEPRNKMLQEYESEMNESIGKKGLLDGGYRTSDGTIDYDALSQIAPALAAKLLKDRAANRKKMEDEYSETVRVDKEREARLAEHMQQTRPGSGWMNPWTEFNPPEAWETESNPLQYLPWEEHDPSHPSHRMGIPNRPGPAPQPSRTPLD